MKNNLNQEKGFTLIELLVVVLIIGILAAVAVPQYFKVVEKGKFAESMSFLGGIQQSEERYLAKTGNYWYGGQLAPWTGTTYPFDANLGSMKYFSATISGSTSSNPPAYTVNLVRISGAGSCPAVYGCYTVTFSGPAGGMTCSDTANCSVDLLPQ